MNLVDFLRDLRALLAVADRQQLPTTPLVVKYPAADPAKVSLSREVVLTPDGLCVKIGGTC